MAMEFDRTKFLAQFKAETYEHLSRLNTGFLKLEKTPADRTLLEEMMREAHTIKGSATMMGFRRVADIAHEMESGLQKALEGEVSLTKPHFDVLFKCVDSIGPLLEDKLTWQEKGVDRPYADKLCNRVRAVFSADDAVTEKPASGEPKPDKKKKEAAKKEEPDESAPYEKEGPKEEPKEEPEKTPAAFHAPEDSLRVEINKLDKLMNLSGELTVSQVRLAELVKQLVNKTESRSVSEDTIAELAKEFKKVDESISFVTSSIQHEVMKVRMVPISYLFHLFPRAMRDLAHKAGKEIDIEIRGEDTYLDKTIIDEMKDPIMHILRNAVDHGIEPVEERKSHGKSPAGKVILKACQVGHQVIIEASDDGRGIDLLRVKQVALAKGLITKATLEEMADEEAYQLLFLPGFSTKEEVTETSGRGVGLDVVREKLSNLKGTIEIVSGRHSGTSFIMKLPLTLAITECLLTAAGSETFAIPIDAVVETIRIELGQIKTVEMREAITVRGKIMPLVRLADIFNLPAKGIIERKYFSVIVVQAVEKKVGILVDNLLGRLNIVNKALGDPLKNVKYLSGATILGDGKVVLILDIPSIVNSFESGAVVVKKQAPAPGAPAQPVKKRRKTILLAEDAMTTAMLEKNILESVGFSVVLAKDGKEALEKASQEKFDLIITDVLMPRMDGFELTSTLKSDKLYKDIPVIIVTTRESDADKRRGLEVGADAYILKSEFTSEGLLNTIERLIG